MQDTLLNLIEPEFEESFQELTDSLEDVVLFCDEQGVVMKNSVGARNFWKIDVTGKPLWSLLHIEAKDINEMLSLYPPGKTCRVSLLEKGDCNIWVIPIPKLLAPKGGFVATVTPLTELQATYEGHLQDNIIARKDSFKLFAALFDAAPDSTILADEHLTILSANPKAIKQFGLSAIEDNAVSFFSIIKNSLKQVVLSGIAGLTGGQVWCDELVAVNLPHDEIPVLVTIKQVRLSDQLLFQIILKDLSIRNELEENLKDREEELESMDNTLRTVLRTVDEEKQEVREEVLEQVKQYLLPTIDIIAEVSSQDLRRSYSGILKSHLEEFSESSAEVADELLALSTRQLEICKLIRVGMKGRDISELLNISFETLQSHRKNIRKKLKLCGTKISLTTYLANRVDLDSE